MKVVQDRLDPSGAGDQIIHTGSISSAVDLDLVHNEAHKVYHPSLPVRVLYWLAFQARFPYIDNHHALEAARLRRTIVDLLTKVWFGHHLVARVLDVADLPGGGHDFVTRLVRGHEPADRPRAKEFLTRLDRNFLEAGLPTWQTTPYNPHAITNFIEKDDGTYRIIDLESSLVAFLYPMSRIVGLIRAGLFPSFDDVDVDRLEAYVREHSGEINAALPPGERDLLDVTIAAYRTQQDLWHQSERRYLPRTLRFALRLVDVPSWIRGIGRLGARSQDRAESFVRESIDIWVQEGRLTPEEADRVREQLSAPPVAYAMLHLGAQFAISIPLRFPFGAIARFLYTVALRIQAEIGALLGRKSAANARETHTLLVALVALLPGFGRLAYLFAKPLRSNSLLFIVPIDVIARKLPLRGYPRLHLDALLDWWAHPHAGTQPATASGDIGQSVRVRIRALAPHRLTMAVIIGANAVLIGAGVFLYASGESTWWFDAHGVLQSAGALQLVLAGIAAIAAYRLFWRIRPRDAADAAGIFLWAALGIGLVVFALDDYLEMHDAVGEFLESRFVSEGADMVESAVVIVWALTALALVYIFRHELAAPRASSVLLCLVILLSVVLAAADLSERLGSPLSIEFSNQELASGFWLLATLIRYREVRAAVPSPESAHAVQPV